MRCRDKVPAMTVCSCILWSNKRLCNRALPVAAITDKVRRRWAYVIEMMLGVGLVAMQISMSMGLLRLIPARRTAGWLGWLILKFCTLRSELCSHYDASANLLEAWASIKRVPVLTVEFHGAKGHCEQRNRAGFWPTSAQHQIDHLVGQMYFDAVLNVECDTLLRGKRKRQ